MQEGEFTLSAGTNSINVIVAFDPGARRAILPQNARMSCRLEGVC
jgi:hypothetical protein